VARDNPCHRYEDGDRRWSRYERPLSAVDLTEYAGSSERYRFGGVGDDFEPVPHGPFIVVDHGGLAAEAAMHDLGARLELILGPESCRAELTVTSC
jgi:hypothetical protein